MKKSIFNKYSLEQSLELLHKVFSPSVISMMFVFLNKNCVLFASLSSSGTQADESVVEIAGLEWGG